MSDDYEAQANEAAERRRALRRQQFDELAERNKQAIEGRYVKMLLTELGLGKHERELCSRNKEEGGDYCLTFRQLAECFPSFPMRLTLFREREPLHLSDDMTLPALFLRFRRTPFYEAYKELWREAKRYVDGRPHGLVAPFKGLDYGFLIASEEYIGTNLGGLVYLNPDPDAAREPEPDVVYMTSFRRAAKYWAANNRESS